MDDLLKMHLTEQSKQNCIYICNKLTEWFAKNAVTVNVNNWVNDYSTGFDTAKDDMKEWCNKKLKKVEINANTSWCYGYRSALIDIIEHIERM